MFNIVISIHTYAKDRITQKGIHQVGTIAQLRNDPPKKDRRNCTSSSVASPFLFLFDSAFRLIVVKRPSNC
jgi:hypothetical protein